MFLGATISLASATACLASAMAALEAWVRIAPLQCLQIVSQHCLDHVFRKCHFRRPRLMVVFFLRMRHFPTAVSVFRLICATLSGYWILETNTSIILTELFRGCFFFFFNGSYICIGWNIQLQRPIYLCVLTWRLNPLIGANFLLSRLQIWCSWHFFPPPFARGSLSVKSWSTSSVPAAAAAAALLLL